MGMISKFNIPALKLKYDLEVAVETGTWLGDGARWLARFFDEIHTIELSKQFYDNAIFAETNIIKYLGDTISMLPQVVTAIGNKKCLYWLDAHLPSAYGNPQSADLEFPLENELRLLTSIKDCTGDYFIIDDLRIYEENNFQSGNTYPSEMCTKLGISFIYELFDKTHIIKRDLRDEGYILIFPKGNK